MSLTKTFALQSQAVGYAILLLFALAPPGFAQEEASDKEAGTARGHYGSESQDRLGLRDTPEDYMQLIYETPTSDSELTRRTDESGQMTAYAQFYYSDDQLLSQYIDAAIFANPSIWEAEHRWRAALQRIPQVSALPDPMFGITQFIHKPETRVGPQETILSISEKFPWFGKLDAKGEIALREALAAAERYQARIREIVAAVKRAYYDLAYFDEAIRVTQQDKGLLEHFEEIAQTRYETGKGIQQAVIKLQAEITRDEDRLYLFRQQRESVAANLNSLMNRPPHDPVPSLLKPDAPFVHFSLEQLYETGQANRHELKAANYMIERGDQAIRLAKKEYFPDFTVGFNYIFVDDRKDALGKLNPPEDNGRDAYSVTLGFNIPLWEGKLTSGVREAEETKRASERGYDTVKNNMEFSIRDAFLRATTTFEQLQLYDKVLIPQAEQALESTEAAYAAGRLNALDLIDSERFLLNVKLAGARLASDYMKALADIERATGAAFPSGKVSYARR